MKYCFIFEQHVAYSVGNQCRVLEVSRAGYYQWRRHAIPKRQRENGELRKRSRVLFGKFHKRYGSPRITKVLQQEGFRCSRNRIARLMREDGMLRMSDHPEHAHGGRIVLRRKAITERHAEIF